MPVLGRSKTASKIRESKRKEELQRLRQKAKQAAEKKTQKRQQKVDKYYSKLEKAAEESTDVTIEAPEDISKLKQKIKSGDFKKVGKNRYVKKKVKDTEDEERVKKEVIVTDEKGTPVRYKRSRVSDEADGDEKKRVRTATYNPKKGKIEKYREKYQSDRDDGETVKTEKFNYETGKVSSDVYLESNGRGRRYSKSGNIFESVTEQSFRDPKQSRTGGIEKSGSELTSKEIAKQTPGKGIPLTQKTRGRIQETTGQQTIRRQSRTEKLEKLQKALKDKDRTVWVEDPERRVSRPVSEFEKSQIKAGATKVYGNAAQLFKRPQSVNKELRREQLREKKVKRTLESIDRAAKQDRRGTIEQKPDPLGFVMGKKQKQKEEVRPLKPKEASEVENIGKVREKIRVGVPEETLNKARETYVDFQMNKAKVFTLGELSEERKDSIKKSARREFGFVKEVVPTNVEELALTASTAGIGGLAGAGYRTGAKLASKVPGRTGAFLTGTYKGGTATVGAGLTGIYTYEKAQEMKKAETPEERAEIAGKSARELAAFGYGFSKGSAGTEAIAGILRTRGRARKPSEELVSKDVLKGEKSFPEAPTRQHLTEFKKTKQNFPEFGGEGGFHSTGGKFWKPGDSISPSPGKSELQGLYISSYLSPHFLRTGSESPKKIFPRSVKEVLGREESPGIAFIKPKRFKKGRWEGKMKKPKLTKKGEREFDYARWADQPEPGAAEAPMAKPEIEAVLRPGSGKYQFESGKYFTEVGGRRVNIDVFKYQEGTGLKTGKKLETSKITQEKSPRELASEYKIPESESLSEVGIRSRAFSYKNRDVSTKKRDYEPYSKRYNVKSSYKKPVSYKSTTTSYKKPSSKSYKPKSYKKPSSTSYKPSSYRKPSSFTSKATSSITSQPPSAPTSRPPSAPSSAPPSTPTSYTPTYTPGDKTPPPPITGAIDPYRRVFKRGWPGKKRRPPEYIKSEYKPTVYSTVYQYKRPTSEIKPKKKRTGLGLRPLPQDQLTKKQRRKKKKISESKKRKNTVYQHYSDISFYGL